ncbi:hypothetical protein OF83DRAFT_1155087 [Amylostereum chailletii]|nr:hypothetical protein OF83DRAFT_1155087 [Amylostereum chailletii]
MGLASVFDLRTQLVFYGAYHSNSFNVAVHIICVPILIWTFQVLSADIPLPSIFPSFHHQFNEYFAFEINFAFLQVIAYIAYYLILEPVAAVLYMPQAILSLLTSTAFSKREDALVIAGFVHSISWIMQFIGHGFGEHRSPALLDNLLGAVVLAPFFVHFEVLFKLGYRPELHKQLTNDVGVEIARIRRASAEKERRRQKAIAASEERRMQ